MGGCVRKIANLIPLFWYIICHNSFYLDGGTTALSTAQNVVISAPYTSVSCMQLCGQTPLQVEYRACLKQYIWLWIGSLMSTYSYSSWEGTQVKYSYSSWEGPQVKYSYSSWEGPQVKYSYSSWEGSQVLWCNVFSWCWVGPVCNEGLWQLIHSFINIINIYE